VDRDEVGHTLARQDGVISRRQVVRAGGTDNDIERLVRRRQWCRVFEGVYVDHTGPLTARQRAWAAVLYAAPAALAGTDALWAHGVRGFDPPEGGAVSLVVPGHRRVSAQPGVRVARLTAFDAQAQQHLSPPRIRLEPAALQVAAASRTDDGAVAALADVCQTRRTTPDRLLRTLQATPRIRRRALLEEILADVASGAFSALERRFLVRVERAHGLPTGARQRRVTLGARPYVRDVTYLGLATVVELDGRLGHERAADRWEDLERDIAGAGAGELTVRVGWLQVLEAHRLAHGLGVLLTARGWLGQPHRCGPDCSLA
jgi:hypothetical protein